jgi:cell division septation protein DedD
MTVYCECEFHDTKTGSDFIRTHTTAIGEAIAQGICDYYGVKPTAAKSATKTAAKTAAPLYVVQAGAFSSEAGAKAQVAKLKKAGFDAFYVKK